jgi:hypothetical protein
MPIRPELLVRGLDGRPLPPQDLLDRIRRYDARIGLFYTNAAWAITEAWTDDDARREWIKRGEMQPEMAFDICGYLPITCSLDEALPYIERELRTHTAESFQAIRYAASHWNDVVQPAMVEEAVLSAVSNDLDASNIVTPGSGVSVAVDIAPGQSMSSKRAEKLLRRAARAG